jgi:hypothetical protein
MRLPFGRYLVFCIVLWFIDSWFISWALTRSDIFFMKISFQYKGRKVVFARSGEPEFMCTCDMKGNWRKKENKIKIFTDLLLINMEKKSFFSDFWERVLAQLEASGKLQTFTTEHISLQYVS